MDAALGWIGQLIEWVGRFFPRWTVLDKTQGAVKSEGFFLPARFRKFKDDVRVTVLGPGLHWWWPATTVMEAYPIAFQTDNLPSQTIETTDNISVTVGGMISYRVSDLGKLLPRCHSAVKAIQTVTLPAIHQIVCRMTWQQLKEEQRKGTLNTKLRNATQKRLAEFGIEVDEVALTDLVKARAYRLIQSTQVDDLD